jgi:hypothetical protein
MVEILFWGCVILYDVVCHVGSLVCAQAQEAEQPGDSGKDRNRKEDLKESAKSVKK